MATATEARARAGEFTDTPALLGEPLPIRDAAGVRTGWFVPLVDGARIVGFVELLEDLAHRRTSGFGTPTCAAAWLDPGVVGNRALRETGPGEVLGEPYLSFDGSPDRLAWAVPVGGPRGPRIVWVAGEAAWSGPAVTGLG